MATNLQNYEKLSAAIKEAYRFIEKAEAWQDELTRDQINQPKYSKASSTNASAAKRASMDLTRSLANLRRRGE